jgi:hypothetical protein
MDAPTLAALIIGLLVGSTLGVIAMCLVRAGHPIGAATQSDVWAAYLLGRQDERDGVDPDVTRPAHLYP